MDVGMWAMWPDMDCLLRWQDRFWCLVSQHLHAIWLGCEIRIRAGNLCLPLSDLPSSDLLVKVLPLARIYKTVARHMCCTNPAGAYVGRVYAAPISSLRLVASDLHDPKQSDVADRCGSIGPI